MRQARGALNRRATLHVDHLPRHMTIGQLRDLFRAHGCYLVSIVLARDKTGESKGHAVVVLPERDAEKAISALDGYDVEGRALRVAVRKAGRPSGVS